MRGVIDESLLRDRIDHRIVMSAGDDDQIGDACLAQRADDARDEASDRQAWRASPWEIPCASSRRRQE